MAGGGLQKRRAGTATGFQSPLAVLQAKGGAQEGRIQTRAISLASLIKLKSTSKQGVRSGAVGRLSHIYPLKAEIMGEASRHHCAAQLLEFARTKL